MEKREDIRITKSKRDLCNALVELMKSTPFKKITVGDICSTAMINKMTFYKHYADKYELLNDVFLNIKQSIIAHAEAAIPTQNVNDTALDLTFRVLDAVINECLNQKQFLMDISHDEMVLTMISTTIEKSIYELLSSINIHHTFKYRLDILTSAVTGATTFLIRYLLLHEQSIGKKQFLEKTKTFLRDLFDSKILFEWIKNF